MFCRFRWAGLALLAGLALHDPQARPAFAESLRPVMKRLAESLTELLVRSGSADDWQSERQRKGILKHLQILLESAQHTPKNADPGFPLLQETLSREIVITRRAFEVHQFEFARMNLRNIVASCMECHSREPEWGGVVRPLQGGALAGLSALSRARYHSAVRNWEQALEEYHRVLFEPGAIRSNLYQWESAFREAQTLLIRVKRDPVQALLLVRKIRALNGLPRFLQRELRDWEQILDAWTREKSPPPDNETALFLEIHRLIRQARQDQAFPMDRSADALFLRASSLLHEFIRKHPKSTSIAEAWRLLGIVQLTLASPPFDTLHEKFFESCIRARPHSPLAESCYQALEQSVMLGFTGSAGTQLPDESRNKLFELWSIAVAPAPGR